MDTPTECPECGGDLYDNRERKASGEYKPNSPDFKCRECDWKKWPPKKSGRGFSADRKVVPGKQFSEDRTRQIVRQHSQEMAIRYCAVKGEGIPKKPEVFRALIDWFDRDVFSTSKPKAAPAPKLETEDYVEAIDVGPDSIRDEGLDL